MYFFFLAAGLTSLIATTLNGTTYNDNKLSLTGGSDSPRGGKINTRLTDYRTFLRKSAKTYIIKLMQPQMPYGTPQGQPGPQGYPNQPNQASPQGYQGPYPPQTPPYQASQGQGQPGYPYNQPSSQPPTQYTGGAGIPGPQPQYGQYPATGAPNQPAMPQYQPPAGYNQSQQHRLAPLPPPPPIQKTPYDFFMQQKHPINTKLPIPGPRQAGLKGKIIWIACGAVVIMLVIVVISALKPKDTSIQSLITIAQTQQEVVRICDLGGAKVTQQTNRNFAVNCSTSVLSDQAKLINYLATQHVKIGSKQLGLLASADNDKQLATAASASNYDATFKTLSAKQVSAYSNTVVQTLGTGQLGSNAQALLNDELSHIKILVSITPTQ